MHTLNIRDMCIAEWRNIFGYVWRWISRNDSEFFVVCVIYLLCGALHTSWHAG